MRRAGLEPATVGLEIPSRPSPRTRNAGRIPPNTPENGVFPSLACAPTTFVGPGLDDKKTTKEAPNHEVRSMGDGLRDVDVGGLRRRAEADGGQGEDVVIDVPAGTVLDLRRAYP